MQREVLCPYCGEPARLMTGALLFPSRRGVEHRMYWRCNPCGAHVGTHRGTDKPLGTIAKQPLRRMRRRAHVAFDTIWKGGSRAGKWPRKRAYQWLAARLGILYRDCHIGQMDMDQCHAVLEAVRERKTGS